MTEPKPKRGRRTKREEAIEILDELGLPRELANDLSLKAKTPDGPVSLENIALGALRELERRLGDPVLASELPGTKLIDLAEKMRAVLEAKNESMLDTHEAEPTVAEVLAGITGLPAKRRKEILMVERKVLAAELAALDAAI